MKASHTQRIAATMVLIIHEDVMMKPTHRSFAMRKSELSVVVTSVNIRRISTRYDGGSKTRDTEHERRCLDTLKIKNIRHVAPPAEIAIGVDRLTVVVIEPLEKTAGRNTGTTDVRRAIVALVAMIESSAELTRLADFCSACIMTFIFAGSEACSTIRLGFEGTTL